MDRFRHNLRKNCSFLMKLDFWCLGFSVNPKESVIYRIYSLTMITAGFLYPWSNLNTILNNLDNFDIVANCMFNFVGGLSASGKMVIMLYQRNHMRYLFDELARIQEERNVEDWSQNEIYRTNRKIGIAVIFYFITIFALCIASLLERLTIADSTKWRTPISEVSVINITYSPNYEIAWTYQSLAVTIMSSAYCITDFLVASITVDLCVQFKIFRKDIKKMFDRTHLSFKKDQDVVETEKNWIELNGLIKKAVLRHISLIDLAAEVEKFTSPMIFLSIAGGLCVICFAIYYAMVLPLFSVKAIQSYFEVGMIACALFFLCYCGTEISFASTSVATACSEIDYVGTDARFQKSLMMIIMRCQKPVGLTVGGFAYLSLPVYVVMLRSTYTYSMVLMKSSDRNSAN